MFLTIASLSFQAYFFLFFRARLIVGPFITALWFFKGLGFCFVVVIILLQFLIHLDYQFEYLISVYSIVHIQDAFVCVSAAHKILNQPVSIPGQKSHVNISSKSSEGKAIATIHPGVKFLCTCGLVKSN